MSNLKKLINICNSGIYLTINPHKGYYKTIEEWIDQEYKKDIKEDVWEVMIATDTCVSLQIYPDTPVGFYMIYHYDADKVIEEAIKILDNEV